MTEKAHPLVPAEVDLRDFAFMPLDVQRLRDSDLASDETPEACWAAVLLWCASWHQVPAASIPDSEQWQAKQAGYASRGRIDPQWAKVREGALRGWVACSDGRLYHPVVAEKAREAWIGKMRQRWSTERARIKKHNDRHEGANVPMPTFEEWTACGCPQGQPLFVPGDKNQRPEDKGGDKASKGQGEGQGHKKSPHSPQGGEPPASKAKPLSTLRTWLADLKDRGEKPIPPSHPVFAYAARVGLPEDMLALAWREFRRTYTKDRDTKRYRDWRKVFGQAVQGNWLKLWHLDAASGQYGLTTVGLQAQRNLDGGGDA